MGEVYRFSTVILFTYELHLFYSASFEKRKKPYELLRIIVPMAIDGTAV